MRLGRSIHGEERILLLKRPKDDEKGMNGVGEPQRWRGGITVVDETLKW